jgi:hypothetical protein
MQGSINCLTDIFEKSMLAPQNDPGAMAHTHTIELMQDHNDGLVINEKVLMISIFMKDVVAAQTYISLNDPEVRLSWVRSMLEEAT